MSHVEGTGNLKHSFRVRRLNTDRLLWLHVHLLSVLGSQGNFLWILQAIREKCVSQLEYPILK